MSAWYYSGTKNIAYNTKKPLRNNILRAFYQLPSIGTLNVCNKSSNQILYSSESIASFSNLSFKSFQPFKKRSYRRTLYCKCRSESLCFFIYTNMYIYGDFF